MNRPSIVRCTATLTNVGTTIITTTFSPNPPINGKIIFVDATFSGPATEISILRIREQLAGSIRVEYTAESADFKDSPGEVPYAVSAPSQLKAQASTDDVGATSTVTLIADIEVN